MNTYSYARTRSLPGLALVLVSLAVSGCAESDLEALHEQRLDDAVAAAGIDSTEPETGAAEPVEQDLRPITQDPDAYELIFSEEFTALSLDESRWNTALAWGPDTTINDEQQYYADTLGVETVDRSPFSFDGEALTITATEVSESPQTPEGRRAAALGLDWISGVLTTAGKFSFTYGYVEARVDLPAGQALWPSIWMLGAEPIDLRPQLFVMERDGGRPDSVFYNYEYVDEAGNLRSPGQYEAEEAGLSEGFHTVGVAWSPEELLFYLDGVPRYRIVGDDVSRQDMYLAMPFAIGGTWTGGTDETTPSPAMWTIDYVRVWQKVEGE